MQKSIIRKPISVLLSLLMLLSVFGGLAFTASAANPIDWTTSNALPAEAGSYKLTTDVTLSSTWSPADGTTLDLNGHKITRNGTILSVGNGVTFTLEDSKKDSTDPVDKHYYTTSRPATISSSETDSYFVGGYLTGARSAIAVVIESGGNFIMNGGTIFGNRNNSDAGGVRVYGNNDDAGLPGGVFTMNDGNIIGNYANWGGGLYLNGGGVFNLNGGSVCSNYAPNGGGGVLTWGTFNMSGGTLAKNSSIGPAGVYLFAGEFHLSGGMITGNTSSRDQGGLGGASKTYISGNPVVTGNTSKGNTSNFVIPNGKTLTLEGPLTEGASIQINTQANPNDGNSIIFVDGWGEYMGDEDPNDYFVSDNNSWQIIQNANGDLQITDPAKTYYTASFAAGEGSGDAPKSVTTAVALTLPENSFTAPDDNLFAGWLSGSDNTLYQPGESVTLTEDTTFTAQWVQAVHVTFEPENGSPAETVLVLPNTTVTAPEGWEKDGMALQGWRLGGTRFDISTPVTEDITLHAIWAEIVTDYDPADAGQIYADFQATAGSAGYNSNEDYPKLVDNNTSTKWCRGAEEGFIEFYSTEAFVPIGYSLTTANDTSSNSGRNPTSWTIQGKVNPGDGWTTIVSVENDTTLEARNYTEYSFTIDGFTSGFRYFRFAYSAVRSGNSFQLSELKFRGIPATASTGHDLSFRAEENVLAANCSNDPCAFEDGKLELTLNAPAKTVYGDGNSEVATLTCLDRFDAELNLLISEDDIKYYNGETLLDAAPTDAGDYTASLTTTIDGTDYTITKNYSIAKADPAYTAPEELTALCGQTLAAIALPESWAWDDETTPVATVGADAQTKDAAYAATFTPADTANYNTASVELTVTVSHAYVNHDAKAPTCTEIGWDAYRTCANCDYTEYVEIPENGHSYGEEDWTDPVPEDCGNDGSIGYYTCTVCGERFDLEGNLLTDGDIVIPATGDHDWIWVTDEDPGCYTAGTKHEYCTVCEQTQSEGTPIPAAHEFDDWVDAVAPTCGKDGNIGYRHCHVCGDNFDAQGSKLQTIVDPATGNHIYSDSGWIHFNAAQHVRYCEICGLAPEYEDHDVIVRGGGDATCTDEGYTGDEICSVCGERLSEGEIIPPKGHTTAVVNAKEATATEDGYTGDEVCAVCGQTIKAGEVIPATGTPDEPTTPDKPSNGGCPLCGEDHGSNTAIKAIHYVMYWLTWLFRDWLPGFFK